jgi:multiple sugar transport system permease protein
MTARVLHKKLRRHAPLDLASNTARQRLTARVRRKKILLFCAMGAIAVWTLFPFVWFFLVSLTIPGHIPRRLELPGVLTGRSYAAVLLGGKYAPVGAETPIVPNVLNSLIMTGLTMTLCLSISLGAAYVFSRFRFRPLRLLLSSLLIVRMTPGVSLAVPVFLLMLRYRLVDTYIGLSMVYTLTSLPLAIWLMKGFFDTIPTELEEQAYIDGATMFIALRKIILPLAAPGIAVTACFIFLSSYIEFLFAMILSRGSINTLPLALAGYMTELQTFYNEMAAASFLSMIPLVLFFYFAGRYMVGGLSLGALK